MLDKSVPYFEILMRRAAGTAFTPCEQLPKDFKFQLFASGDEKSWAQIETSVLEFDSEIDALLYFQKEYMPYVKELERRCVFIENPQGEKIATATAFWTYTGARRDPWLHWVAVNPKYQGIGLGKAIVSRVMAMMLEIEGDRDFYLHTQTWSHRAVALYKQFGYEPTGEPGLGGYANEKCAEALELLDQIDATT